MIVVRTLILSLILAASLAGFAGCGGTAPAPDVTDGGASDGGLPFGSPCTMNGDCASNVCFVGGNRSFCSKHCTMGTQAIDCAIPPTSGICNNQGYCKP